MAKSQSAGSVPALDIPQKSHNVFKQEVFITTSLIAIGQAFIADPLQKGILATVCPGIGHYFSKWLNNNNTRRRRNNYQKMLKGKIQFWSHQKQIIYERIGTLSKMPEIEDAKERLTKSLQELKKAEAQLEHFQECLIVSEREEVEFEKPTTKRE
jgi:hypothetical protein